MGTHVWGRTTAYLSGRRKSFSSTLGCLPNAFRPIVNAELFERARKRLVNVSYRLSNEQLLECLKSIAAESGKHLQ